MKKNRLTSVSKLAGFSKDGASRAFYDIARTTLLLMQLCTAWSMTVACNPALALQPEPPALSSSNIGFMKHPPAQARQDFPMCDEFLDVRWIDKARKIGLAQIDLYVQEGEKFPKPLMTLVHLDHEVPRFDYDFSAALKKHKRSELISAIREGTIVDRNSGIPKLSFNTREGKKLDFISISAKNFSGDETLANYLKTVCVLFPEQRKIWIAEQKRDAAPISIVAYKLMQMKGGTYTVAIPTLSNKGFIKNPPASLKKRFPMCDRFLAVEWIDREKRIGISEIDLYMPDGSKDKRPSLALIHVNNYFPRFTFDLGAALKTHRRSEIYSAIQNGTIERETTTYSLRITSPDGRKLEILPFSDSRDAVTETLAQDRLNVCIPFPGNARMWLAERKQFMYVYNDKVIEQREKEIGASIPDFKMLPITTELDINQDGKQDYFGGGGLFYSYGNQYFAMAERWKHERDPEYATYSFPPTARTCALQIPGYFLTTDGYNYFLNDQCNLTELTNEGMQR